MEASFETVSRHDGYNVKRLREILGIKQDELADKLGMTQQAISKIEQKDILEDDLLDKIGSILNVPTEAIKNFNDEKALNVIVHTMHDNASINQNYYNPTFNPIDKVVELYERMLKAEQEKVSLLEEVLRNKK